ncbi:hypothetical protein K439DRAFT_1627519 [Ramaria rubella]|nr:hypothetical protein K439DRAFT_1627519 [Ramaria rubella]
MSSVTQILAVVLFSLGCISLSALLLTANATEKVPRHPVFVNFLRTWLLWSSFMLYISVAALATPFIESSSTVKFQTALRDMLWMSTQVATLNFVIHVTMHSLVIFNFLICFRHG